MKYHGVIFSLGLLLPFACSSVWAAESVKQVLVTASADSEHHGYEAWRAMDQDQTTCWHTEYSDNVLPHPHTFFVDLKGSYPVRGFTLTQRQDMSNGNFTRFDVYLSHQKNDPGEPVLTIHHPEVRLKEAIIFPDAVTGRYLTVEIFNEVANHPWSTIAELDIHCDGVKFIASTASGLPAEIQAMAGDPELKRQYAFLLDSIAKRAKREQYAEQVFIQDSRVFPSDRDPVDVVLRRTAALWDDLKSEAKTDFSGQIKQLQKKNDSLVEDDVEKRYLLFEEICRLRRQIAFSNPLLDFDEILFVKRHRSTYNHMCDQYYGSTSVPGGGVFVLSEPFADNPRIRNLLADSTVKNGRLQGKKLENGAFVTPSLSYDGQKLAFAFVECAGDKQHRHHTDLTRGHWDDKDCHHVFTVDIDGSALTQLTDGTWNDFDPCWLPNDRIAFISERRGGYLRCGRACPNFTLFDMDPDGGRMRCLSYHETNEWNPSVTHDGRILYTRWDYVDRHGCTAHHPWITTLDGRDSRAVHGNFALRPLRTDMEVGCKPIPDSPKFVATAAPHHGQMFGSLVIVDPRVEDDNVMGPVKRITPDVDFPETQKGAQVFGTPWPLSEKYYLAVADLTFTSTQGAEGQKYQRGDYGIYLVDAFGNYELIYRDDEIGSLSPIPLRPQASPPAPSQYQEREITHQPYVVPKRGEDTPTATISIVNVRESWVPLPEEANIKEMRVLQLIPMSVPSGQPPHETGLREPTSLDSVVLPRYVLGTVPVEEDGSVHLSVPAEREILFQLIDENGLAIQSMRSATYLQGGEVMVCQGCHEPTHRAPSSSADVPLAMRREPSRLKPDVDGSNPFSYPQLVQPVLDQHCVSCHSEKGEAAPNLAKEPIQQNWYASYVSLVKDYGFYSYGNSVTTNPAGFGAKSSKLYQLLKNGHYDVNLSDEELHRLTLWMDCCSIFYGVYEKEGGIAQLQGETVFPTLE